MKQNKIKIKKSVCRASSKIKKKLSWKHIYSLDKALIETIEWYIKNPKFYDTKQKRKFGKRLGLIND